MPVLTFPLALLFASCFAAGAVVTWVLNERRARRERVELEKQMTRALQTRYEVYEGLEHSVVKLMTKFDAMEGEFRQRLELARNPQIALAQTAVLRSSNPELWDIEREHHKVHAQQAGEIARSSARIHELMTQLEAAEPGVRRLETEVASIKGRYEVAVANAHEAEQAAATRIERLQHRVDELEPLPSMLEANRRELEAARSTQCERDAAHAVRMKMLESRLATLEPAAKRTGELEQALAQREHDSIAHAKRTDELERALSDMHLKVDSLRSRCGVLDRERDEARAAFAMAQESLVATRTSQSALQVELERCRAELAEVGARCDNQKSSLAEALDAAAELRRDVALAEQLAGDRDTKIGALERELTAIRAENASRWDGAQRELVEARAALQSSQEQCDGLVRGLAANRSDYEARIVGLQKELADARAAVQANRGHIDGLERDLAGTRALHQARWSAAQQELAEEREALQASRAQIEGHERTLEGLRRELAGAGAQVEAAKRAHEGERGEWTAAQDKARGERAELEKALAASQAQLVLYRAKLSHHSSHVEEAWSVLTELKPMLETLEQKLKDTEAPAPALPAAKEVAFDLSVLDDPAN